MPYSEEHNKALELHLVAAAEVNRSIKCFKQPLPKRPNKQYKIIHPKNRKLNNKNTQLIEEPNRNI